MRNRNVAPRTAQEFQATSARARAQAKERELEAARAKRLGAGKAKPKLPPGRAMLRGLEAFVRYRFRGRRISERDGERIMDVLLCFWASLARELDKPPGWARGWACMIVPVLADARDDAWWLARERRASRRRKGNGWKPDAAAKHWGIREHQLDECFGPNKRRRCGLVSIDRPPEVRAEEKREMDRARKR